MCACMSTDPGVGEGVALLVVQELVQVEERVEEHGSQLARLAGWGRVVKSCKWTIVKVTKLIRNL